MKYKIAVDLGGSKIYSGLFLKDRSIRVLKFKTEVHKGKRRILKNIIKSIEEAIGKLDKKEISGIGIASPGPLDYNTGEIITTPNIPLKNFNLKKFVENKFGIKTRIDNDAKCAGIAEAKARNAKNMIYLTLGTGLGSCLIYNGRIYRGDLFATEFGHMTINFDGPRCACGRKGCLEVYTNSKAILRYSKEKGLEGDAYEIQKKALAGKRAYKKVYKKIGKYLGIGIANIVNSIDINLIVIGGGIGKAGDLIIKPAIKEMNKNLLVRKNVKVEKAKLQEYASLIGAAELF